MLLWILTFDSESDREKFEYIYQKYRNLMLHKAYGVLRDYALAEDAVSEAFLRIYRNIHKIGEPDDPRSVSFVATVVKNAALTLLSKENRAEYGPIDGEQEDGFDLEAEALSALTAENIYALLNEIGDDLRHVFVLKYAHDLSHKEIAGVLGITENNVTVRLYRAKKKLAEVLRREGYARG